MLDNGRDQLSILDDRLDLLWYGLFLKVTLFLANRYTNVDGARLARNDFDIVDASLGEVDLARVGIVNLNSRDLTEDLDGKGWG